MGNTSLTRDFPLLNAPPPISSYFSFGSDVFLVKIGTHAPSLRYSALLGFYGMVGPVDLATHGTSLYLTGTEMITDFVGPFLVRSPIWGGPFERQYLGLPLQLPIAQEDSGRVKILASAVAADGSGNVYVAGEVFYFSRYGSQQGDHHPIVVAKLDSVRNVLYLTMLDTQSYQKSTDIAVDREGNAYVAGFSDSADLATTPGAFQGSRAGAREGFVLKVGPSGDIEYLTYLGGSGEDEALGIAVDVAGHAIVTGQTSSADFPVHASLQSSLRGNSDAFVAKLTPDGSDLVFSTYLGGFGAETGAAIDAIAGRFFVAGTSSSVDFPLVNPIPRPCEEGSPGLCGPSDAFLTALRSDGSALIFSTLLGGSATEEGDDLAISPQGEVGIIGTTGSADMPLVNAVQSALAGRLDAFIAKLQVPNQAPACAAAVASPNVIWPPNGRLVPVSITGVTDPEGDNMTLVITGITQDEPLSGRGSDASGIGTPNAQVRADRRGGGDGRVYTLAFEARDELGAACTGAVTVCVPHDRRPGAGCGDNGVRYSSAGSR